MRDKREATPLYISVSNNPTAQAWDFLSPIIAFHFFFSFSTFLAKAFDNSLNKTIKLTNMWMTKVAAYWKPTRRTLLSQEKILSLSCYTFVCKAFLTSALYAENPMWYIQARPNITDFYVWIQRYYAFSLSFFMRTGLLLLKEKLKCDLSFNTEQLWQSLERRQLNREYRMVR